MDSTFLSRTQLLDFEHPQICHLIDERGWARLPGAHRVGAIYGFVRDEIGFGYNCGDAISASRVLADGYGQCNTKTTLLMALLRGSGVPSRFHGATIHKRLQKGIVDGLFYQLAPENIIHSWAEVLAENRWVGLDGLRLRVHNRDGPFLGYGVGTDDLADPPIDWVGEDTAIQTTGINHDFGVFQDPDAFYAKHGANLSGAKAWLFRNLIRHMMNRRVKTIRMTAAESR